MQRWARQIARVRLWNGSKQTEAEACRRREWNRGRRSGVLEKVAEREASFEHVGEPETEKAENSENVNYRW